MKFNLPKKFRFVIFTVILISASFLILYTQTGLVTNVSNVIAAFLPLPDKFCDDPSSSSQTKCTLGFIKNIQAAGTSPYQDVQGNVSISGKLGIGTASPLGQLHINSGPQWWSSFNYGPNLIVDGTRNNAIGILDSTSSHPWAIANLGGTLKISRMPGLTDITNPPVEVVSIGWDGIFSILHPNSNYRFSSGATVSSYTTTFNMDDIGLKISQNSNSRNIRVVSGTTGGVQLNPGATAWSAVSDERLKDILAPLDNGIGKLMDLRPVYYKLKSDSTNTRRVGLIAQDVEKVLPEAVSADANGYLSLRYTELIPLMIKAIKEQQKEIEGLQNQIKELQAK